MLYHLSPCHERAEARLAECKRQHNVLKRVVLMGHTQQMTVKGELVFHAQQSQLKKSGHRSASRVMCTVPPLSSAAMWLRSSELNSAQLAYPEVGNGCVIIVKWPEAPSHRWKAPHSGGELL